MKFLKTILISLAMFVSAGVFAQEMKFGHVNVQLLVALMPERDSAMVQLENYGKSLEETMVGMQNEFQEKYRTYEAQKNTWSASVLQAKTAELQDMQARMTNFEQNAQSEYQSMYQMLFAPVMNKANEAIQKVGAEKGLVYIFDISSGILPYVDSSKSEDLLPALKKKLGIPEEKVSPTVLGGQQGMGM